MEQAQPCFSFSYASELWIKIEMMDEGHPEQPTLTFMAQFWLVRELFTLK